MAKERFGKIALGKAQQVIPTAEVSLTAMSNRIAILEGQLLNSRLSAAESKIVTLENQVATLLLHKHNYDDGGVQKTTSTII